MLLDSSPACVCIITLETTFNSRYLLHIMNINGSAAVQREHPVLEGVTVASPVSKAGTQRRSISPEAGRGLEILGHSIEYLTDEFVHDGLSVAEDNGRVQAIQLLMALNRQVYFSCPIKLTLGERFRSLVGLLIRCVHETRAAQKPS
jgi:hypothetical protein